MQIINDEIILDEDTLITTKTDLAGRIKYANSDFVTYSHYTERELINANHNIVRNPFMPRIIFKVLWDTIQNGEEINAFVVNKSKNGLDYWVFANVTPSFDRNKKIIGYYSARRKPNRKALDMIKSIYKTLLDEEKRAKSNGQNDMLASYNLLVKMLEDLKMSHQELFMKLQNYGKV